MSARGRNRLWAHRASSYHLHHDSDEAAYVLSGEVTFKIADEVTVGGPGTCAFMPRGVQHAWLQRHGWEIVGPNPL